MRSSGGTNFELVRLVVDRTKSKIACFAGPSFHEASWPDDGCAHAEPARSHAGIGSAARPESRPRRLMVIGSGLMLPSFQREAGGDFTAAVSSQTSPCASLALGSSHKSAFQLRNIDIDRARL